MVDLAKVFFSPHMPGRDGQSGSRQPDLVALQATSLGTPVLSLWEEQKEQDGKTVLELDTRT